MKIKTLIAIIFALSPAISVAAEIHGKISAVDNLWVSAQNEQGGLVPSEWELPTGLPTGERLIAGSVASNAAQSIWLTNKDNTQEKIELNIAILGIQYHVASHVSKSSSSGDAITTVTGNEVVVKGYGIGDQTIEFANQNSMIKMYRPILEDIDMSNVQTALQGKSKGTYIGVLPIVFHYDYYRNDVRVKQTVTTTLQISIEYNPAIIFDAVITSGFDGKLTPRYHGYPEQVVSGQGTYGVTVTGDFASGLRARILNQSTHYTLKNAQVVAGDVTKEIAYSVTCVMGCTTNNQMIEDGQASSDFTQIDNTNISEANIELMVHFENKPYEDLENGEYQGQFQVLFEAQL